jgi:hypothetical protein
MTVNALGAKRYDDFAEHAPKMPFLEPSSRHRDILSHLRASMPTDAQHTGFLPFQALS